MIIISKLGFFTVINAGEGWTIRANNVEDLEYLLDKMGEHDDGHVAPLITEDYSNDHAYAIQFEDPSLIARAYRCLFESVDYSSRSETYREIRALAMDSMDL